VIQQRSIVLVVARRENPSHLGKARGASGVFEGELNGEPRQEIGESRSNNI